MTSLSKRRTYVLKVYHAVTIEDIHADSRLIDEFLAEFTDMFMKCKIPIITARRSAKSINGWVAFLYSYGDKAQVLGFQLGFLLY